MLNDITEIKQELKNGLEKTKKEFYVIPINLKKLQTQISFLNKIPGVKLLANASGLASLPDIEAYFKRLNYAIENEYSLLNLLTEIHRINKALPEEGGAYLIIYLNRFFRYQLKFSDYDKSLSVEKFQSQALEYLSTTVNKPSTQQAALPTNDNHGLQATTNLSSEFSHPIATATSIDILPADILLIIISFLRMDDRVNFSKVKKSWHVLSKNQNFWLSRQPISTIVEEFSIKEDPSEIMLIGITKRIHFSGTDLNSQIAIVQAIDKLFPNDSLEDVDQSTKAKKKAALLVNIFFACKKIFQRAMGHLAKGKLHEYLTSMFELIKTCTNTPSEFNEEGGLGADHLQYMLSVVYIDYFQHTDAADTKLFTNHLVWVTLHNIIESWQSNNLNYLFVGNIGSGQIGYTITSITASFQYLTHPELLRKFDLALSSTSTIDKTTIIKLCHSFLFRVSIDEHLNNNKTHETLFQYINEITNRLNSLNYELDEPILILAEYLSQVICDALEKRLTKSDLKQINTKLDEIIAIFKSRKELSDWSKKLQAAKERAENYASEINISAPQGFKTVFRASNNIEQIILTPYCQQPNIYTTETSEQQAKLLAFDVFNTIQTYLNDILKIESTPNTFTSLFFNSNTIMQIKNYLEHCLSYFSDEQQVQFRISYMCCVNLMKLLETLNTELVKANRDNNSPTTLSNNISRAITLLNNLLIKIDNLQRTPKTINSEKTNSLHPQ